MSPNDDTVSRRRFLQATGGAASAAALAGCLDDDAEIDETDDAIGDDDDDTSDAADDDAADDEFDNTFYLLNGSMDTLDPIRAELANTNEVVRQIFDTLVYRPNGELTIENLLIEEYEVTDDFLTYTFHLKEGVQFHGGYGELTADDVVYSWERLAASPNSRRAYYLTDDLGIVHETYEDEEGVERYEPESMAVEIIDDYTLEVTLDSPNYVAFDHLAFRGFAPIPEGIIGDIGEYDGEIEHSEFESDGPIGTGPFELEYWEPEQEVEASAFDEYHAEGPHVDGVHWQIITDSNAQYNYSMNENVDVLEIPTAQYEAELLSIEEEDELGREFGTYGPMRNDRTAEYMRTAGLSTGFISFNTDNVIKPARQATAYVLDHDQISNDIYKGRTEPGHFMTPPSGFPGGVEEYNRLVEEEYPYGPGSMIDEAREVMEEAGYSEDDRYEFSFSITDSDVNQQFAQLLRDQLAAAHIELEIEVAPFATLVEQSNNGNIDAMIDGWGMSNDDPSAILQLANPPVTRQENPGNIIVTEWTGTDAAERAEEAWNRIQEHPLPDEDDEQVRGEAFVEMELANWEDLPFLNYEHRIYDRFSYEWVDMSPFGAVGGQKYNTVELSQRD